MFFGRVRNQVLAGWGRPSDVFILLFEPEEERVQQIFSRKPNSRHPFENSEIDNWIRLPSNSFFFFGFFSTRTPTVSFLAGATPSAFQFHRNDLLPNRETLQSNFSTYYLKIRNSIFFFNKPPRVPAHGTGKCGGEGIDETAPHTHARGRRLITNLNLVVILGQLVLGPPLPRRVEHHPAAQPAAARHLTRWRPRRRPTASTRRTAWQPRGRWRSRECRSRRASATFRTSPRKWSPCRRASRTGPSPNLRRVIDGKPDVLLNSEND